MGRVTPLLEVEAIEAVYGGAILALRDISLTVEEGAIVALLGSNGAGKTTTLRAISNLLGTQRGVLRSGTVRWRGEPTTRLGPSEIVRRGIVQVLEGRHVFAHLTVEENLRAGGFLRRPTRRQIVQDLERIYEWFPRLKHRRAAKAGLTSGGEQQMVAIGRALMTRPKLMLLDEPSMGLAPIVVQEIFEIVRRLRDEEGVSFLLAEQNANLVLDYADHAYVLETGRIVASGAAEAIADSNLLSDVYLGGGSAATSHEPARP